jgi:hypothetical protein
MAEAEGPSRRLLPPDFWLLSGWRNLYELRLHALVDGAGRGARDAGSAVWHCRTCRPAILRSPTAASSM